MTTSGTVSYNPVRDTIVRRALRMIGAFASSDNPRPEQLNDAIEVLNIMLKDWQMDGLLWLKIWATLFLNKGQRQYVLGPSTFSGFSHCAFAYSPGITPYVQTNTSSATALGANHIHVNSVSGIANEELLILDVAPATIWSVGNTITGATSLKTCTVVTVLTSTTYMIKDRNGAFTLGEVLSNGTFTADQGATYPIVTPGSDYVGIANNSGIIEWFYGLVSGLVIYLYTNSTLTTAGTLSVAASSGTVVYSHKVASQINRPTRLFSFARKYYDVVVDNGMEIPFDLISRTEYEALPNKMVQGKVIETYYDPQLVAGLLYVWPTPDYPGDKLLLTMDRPIQDVVNDSNTFDVPQEALDAIAYCLAIQLEPEYPLDAAAFQKLATVAVAKKAKLLGYNRENVSTRFQPDMR